MAGKTNHFRSSNINTIPP